MGLPPRVSLSIATPTHGLGGRGGLVLVLIHLESCIGLPGAILCYGFVLISDKEEKKSAAGGKKEPAGSGMEILWSANSDLSGVVVNLRPFKVIVDVRLIG